MEVEKNLINGHMKKCSHWEIVANISMCVCLWCLFCEKNGGKNRKQNDISIFHVWIYVSKNATGIANRMICDDLFGHVF